MAGLDFQNYFDNLKVVAFIKTLIKIIYRKLYMKNYDKIMKNIGNLGEKYYNKYLKCWKGKILQHNWWEALKFFFSHSFMRGRRDELSNEYYSFTIKALENYLGISNTELNKVFYKLKKNKEFFNKEDILRLKRNKKNTIRDKEFKNLLKTNPIIKLLNTSQEVEIEWNNKTYKKNLPK